ncbi:phospholipase [Ilyonectria robusta]
MPDNDIRLLALDGGGVRGLSSRMILQNLMSTIDPDSPSKPCDYFDMICGTSTGGLIAIMLGRLRMTVDECIDATVDAAHSDEGVAVELTAVHYWLDRLEAKLNPSSGVSQATSLRGKRKQTVPAMTRPKRQRESREVNTPSSRVSQKACSRIKRKQNAPSTPSLKDRGRIAKLTSCLRTKRKAGSILGRGFGAGTREEVDGGFLLCYSSDLSIEVRANADWLPLVVRWNDETEVFEGMDNIDGRRLEVNDKTGAIGTSAQADQKTGVFDRRHDRQNSVGELVQWGQISIRSGPAEGTFYSTDHMTLLAPQFHIPFPTGTGDANYKRSA